MSEPLPFAYQCEFACSSILSVIAYCFLDICTEPHQYIMACNGNWFGRIKNLANFIVNFNHHKNRYWGLVGQGNSNHVNRQTCRFPSIKFYPKPLRFSSSSGIVR